MWDTLEVGDTIIIQGNKTGSVSEKVLSMQIDGKNVETVTNDSVGIKLENIVRENDHVYKKVLLN